MKYFCKIIFSIAVIFFSYQAIYSCTCEDPSQRKIFKKAKAVFVGTVVEVKEATTRMSQIFLVCKRFITLNSMSKNLGKVSKTRHISRMIVQPAVFVNNNYGGIFSFGFRFAQVAG